MDEYPTRPMQRSRLVTVLAWTFIVTAGFSLLGSLLQTLMLLVVSSQNELNLELAFGSDALPPGAAFLIQNIRLLSFLSLFVSAAVLFASIEFLRRREWARVAIIVILGLSIAWTFAGVALQYAFLSPSGVLAGGTSEMAEGIASMVPALMLVGGILAFAHAAVCGWLIVRLNSPAIKGEFLEAR